MDKMKIKKIPPFEYQNGNQFNGFYFEKKFLFSFFFFIELQTIFGDLDAKMTTFNIFNF